MSFNGIINSVPLLLMFFLTFAFVLLGFELGRWLGARRREHRGEHEAPVNTVVAATFGLLAFLLAFTFNMGANRFERRAQVVLEEANAIATTYLRTDFLPEPQRSELRSELLDYARLRAQGVTYLLTPEGAAKTTELQQRIWDQASAASLESTREGNAVLAGLFVQATNELLDIDEVRLQWGRNYVPDSIWYALYLVTFIAMAIAGYQFGVTGTRRRMAVALLALAFTLVLMLIADLDRPQGGFLEVSQQPILDVINMMVARGQ